jgi:hypothetical protein
MSRVVLADVAGHGEVVSSVADRLRTRKHVDTWPQSILLAGAVRPRLRMLLLLAERTHTSQTSCRIDDGVGYRA